MAEWKTQVTYNYNPSYHAYAYSVVYQPVAEQNHGNLTAWGDNGVTDLSNYNGGATQSLSAAAATTTRTGEESPPRSPETNTVTGSCYQGDVYLGEPQRNDRVLARHPPEGYGTGGSELKRGRSDSVSDSEASPDSWSSVSSREGSLPHLDPSNWAERHVNEELVIRSPDSNEDVSSSLMEDSQNLAIQGSEVSNIPIPVQVPLSAPKKFGTNTATNPKAKVRAAFSESQMNALVQRFSVQRYLTPAEMDNLAQMTGLTYKQVKTWFQNRRMKLRRHQKDTSWVSERYAIHKESSVNRPVLSNMAPHVTPYQGDGLPQFREHYNQHMMAAAFKKTPQNLAYYLAAVGGTAGTPGYPPWSNNTLQATVPNLPHAAGWSVPQGAQAFNYNPNTFNSNNYVHTENFESKEGKPISSSVNATAVVNDGNQ